jgi:hypothetical protein
LKKKCPMMRVAQISRANGPIELAEREIPEPGPNAVRVTVDAVPGGGAAEVDWGAENGDSFAWAFVRPRLDAVTEEFGR